jgi:CRP-like cAMP-binding protein
MMVRTLLDAVQLSSGAVSAPPIAERDSLPTNQLFSSLQADEALELARLTRLYTVESGRALTIQGQAVEDVYFIRRGRARAELSAAEAGAPVAVVSFLGPGSDIGLISILDGAAHSVTIRAVGDLVVAAVPLRAMTDLLHRHPEWYVTLAHLAVSRLRVSGGWLEKLL